MYLTPHDNHMPPLPSRDCVAIRHPGQVPQSGTRAGIQKESDYIEFSLDSGSRPTEADSSGMTGSANCDIVSKGRGDFRGVKCISSLRNEGTGRLHILLARGPTSCIINKTRTINKLYFDG